MRLTIRHFSPVLLVLMQWSQRSHAVSERTRLEHIPQRASRDGSTRRRRHLKSKSKSKEYSPVAWSPAMAPQEYYDQYYAREPPTKEPSYAPTKEPSYAPITYTPEPSTNFFSDSDEKTETSADNASLKIPQHIVAKVSVAIPRAVAPLDVNTRVAKVTTKVIRSYTPFVVYMLDGSRQRQLQSTDLEYDPKSSSISIAFHGVQASWWQFSVAYKVTKLPEELEEVSGINELATSAVEGAILSGLFEQLLVPIAPQVVAVALPGRELDQYISDNPPKGTSKGTASQPMQNDEKKSRRVAIGLAICCIVVVLMVVAIVVVALRRKRRSNEAAWAIPLGEQKERGEVLNTEWNAAFNGETATTPSEDIIPMGTFTIAVPMSSDPPGSYMFGRWEQGTDPTDGTDLTREGTDDACSALNTSLDSSLSIESGSFA